jgi:uncharacterized protein
LRGRIGVYFAPVTSSTEVCVGAMPHCLGGQHWARSASRLQLIAMERGYGAPALPRARRNVCLADRASDLVIVPSGLVFKCWNDVTSPDQAIFDLTATSRTPTMENNLSMWLNWGPYNFPDCERCSVLPLCMGGCPHDSLRRGRGACRELRYNLKESILLHYLDQKRRQGARQLIEALHQWLPEIVPSICQ